MTAVLTIVAAALLVAAYFALVAGLRSFCQWAVNRESERTAAATFEADFIPEVLDYADDDLPAMLSEIEALLDDCTAHVERLVFAAEIAELEETG